MPALTFLSYEWMNFRWARRKTPTIIYFFSSTRDSADFKSLLLRHKASACLLSCLFWAKDKNILLESHLEVEAGLIVAIFHPHHQSSLASTIKNSNETILRSVGWSWQGVLLKCRVLTALKVIKVLWDCVCDSPAGRDVLHTHTGTLQWGCGHRGERGMRREEWGV